MADEDIDVSGASELPEDYQAPIEPPQPIREDSEKEAKDNTEAKNIISDLESRIQIMEGLLESLQTAVEESEESGETLFGDIEPESSYKHQPFIVRGVKSTFHHPTLRLYLKSDGSLVDAAVEYNASLHVRRWTADYPRIF